MGVIQALKHIDHWQVEAAIVSKLIFGKCSASALKVSVFKPLLCNLVGTQSPN